MSRGTPIQEKIFYNSPLFLKNIISSIYGWGQKKERYGEFYLSYLKFLKKSQNFSDEQLKEYQLKKLKDFFIYVETNCKYYRDLFNKIGFNANEFQGFNDIKLLPLLVKDKLRQETSKFITRKYTSDNVIWSHTSGTTGKALHFPLSKECFQREYAFRELHHNWAGIFRGDKIALCAGHPVTKINSHKPPYWTYDYINNWLILSSYHLTENNLEYYLKELKKYKPDLIKGYPSSIYLLAMANKYLGYNIQPKSVITASESLLDFQRNLIESSFNCKVFNWYGTAEMCGNIVECEEHKLHVKSEHSYLEFLDQNNNPAKPGEEGRIVCTGFGNYAFPLIRYDIGDIAILSKEQPCACGRKGTLVDKIIGRVEDYILTPDGRYIGRLDHIFKDSINVNNAQICQENINQVTILIEKNEKYNSTDELNILKMARLRMGNEIEIYFKYVSKISRLDNGKFRFIVSNIDNKSFFGKSIQY